MIGQMPKNFSLGLGTSKVARLLRQFADVHVRKLPTICAGPAWRDSVETRVPVDPAATRTIAPLSSLTNAMPPEPNPARYCDGKRDADDDSKDASDPLEGFELCVDWRMRDIE